MVTTSYGGVGWGSSEGKTGSLDHKIRNRECDKDVGATEWRRVLSRSFGDVGFGIGLVGNG